MCLFRKRYNHITLCHKYKNIFSRLLKTLGYIYRNTTKKIMVGIFRTFMRFSPALENSRDDSRHISRADAGRRVDY